MTGDFDLPGAGGTRSLQRIPTFGSLRPADLHPHTVVVGSKICGVRSFMAQRTGVVRATYQSPFRQAVSSSSDPLAAAGHPLNVRGLSTSIKVVAARMFTADHQRQNHAGGLLQVDSFPPESCGFSLPGLAWSNKRGSSPRISQFCDPEPGDSTCSRPASRSPSVASTRGPYTIIITIVATQLAAQLFEASLDRWAVS